MKARHFIVGMIFIAAVVALAGMHFNGETTVASAGAVDWKSFDAAIAMSRSQGKRILVDVYTNWCSWCKKMDKEVYTDPGVASRIRDHFIPVKLNAESGSSLTYEGKQMTEAQFAKALGVSGYPTTIFLEAGGKPLTIVPGYIPANDYATILRFIGEGHYQSKSYEAFRSERQKAK